MLKVIASTAVLTLAAGRQFAQESYSWSEAFVSIRKENVVYESPLPYSIVNQIRQAQVTVLEELVHTDVFHYIVEDVTRSVAAQSAFGNLVNVVQAPVNVYDRFDNQVHHSVDLSQVVAFSVDGVKRQTVRPQNSEYWFVIEEPKQQKPVKQQMNVLNFPTVEIVLGSRKQQKSSVNVSNFFVAEFMAKREQLVQVKEVQKPKMDFEWFTMVLEEAPKPKKQPKVVKKEPGFVVEFLQPLYNSGRMAPVYVAHPMEQFWFQFMKKEKATKEQVAKNLQGTHLSLWEKRVIAQDYANDLIQRKQFEDAQTTVERLILKLEFVFPGVSTLGLSPKERSAASKLFLEIYGSQFVAVAMVGTTAIQYIPDEERMEAALKAFLTTEQSHIYTVVIQEEESRRRQAEVDSWNAYFGQAYQVVTIDPALEAAMRRERAEADRVQKLNAMLQRIEMESRRQDAARRAEAQKDEEAVRAQLNYERMWNDLKFQREQEEMFRFYGEQAQAEVEEPALTDREIAMFQYWEEVQAGQQARPCGLEHVQRVTFEEIENSYNVCTGTQTHRRATTSIFF